jgi:predicted kinase
VRGFVVELCGLPGTGKSTLAGSVRETLTSRGVPCTIVDGPVSAAAPRHRRIARKAAHGAVQAVGHPLRTAAASRWAMASGQESTRDAVAWVAQWLAVHDVLARARTTSGVNLVEEGVVQSLWTLALRARRDPVRQLLDHTPPAVRGDLLVVVEAPVDVVTERLAARSSRHSRTQSLSAGAQADELRRGELLLDRLIASVQVPVVRVTNDRPGGVAELAQQVADRIVGSSQPSPLRGT